MYFLCKVCGKELDEGILMDGCKKCGNQDLSYFVVLGILGKGASFEDKYLVVGRSIG